jgi:hypothetical protein
MEQSRIATPTASNFQTIGRQDSRNLDLAQGYTPEQVFAGAVVIGILALALFGLVLWNEIKRDCWEMHSSIRGCAISSADAGGASWSPGGMGSLPKSQLLQ